MTKSTGVGRGGRRVGAGRKPKDKPVLPPVEAPAPAETVEDVEALARSYTSVAIQALAEIASRGEKEAARVAAANALLDRGYGKPGASGASDGKKAQRQANAEKVATGRFAPRSGPRLAVNNG